MCRKFRYDCRKMGWRVIRSGLIVKDFGLGFCRV